MALKIPITQEDGVVTNYHRIRILDLMVNESNSIAILSYIDRAAREAEKAGTLNPYVRGITYMTDYDQGMTIETAYQWLKDNILEFKGAEDVLEGASEGG